MKLPFRSAAALSAALMLVSCLQEPVLSVSADQVSIDALGVYSPTIRVSSNHGWEIDCSEDWVDPVLRPENVILISAGRNDTGKDREAVIRITSKDLIQSVKVSQEALYFRADEEITIPFDAEKIDVSLETNYNFRPSCWSDINITGISQSGKRYTLKIVLACGKNTTNEARVFPLYFYEDNTYDKRLISIIKLRQPVYPFLYADENYVDWHIDSKENLIWAILYASYPLSVDMSEVEGWITQTGYFHTDEQPLYNYYSYDFKAKENDTGEPRSGRIRFYTDYHEIFISVRQDAFRSE